MEVQQTGQGEGVYLKAVIVPFVPFFCGNVLDNFDAICSDLNIGLPAEIEARRKQYGYYKDKMLSFKDL